LALGLAACSQQADDHDLDFPVDHGPDGKSDTLGRRLAGIPHDYEAADLDEEELVGNMGRRRAVAWQTVCRVLDPVPLLGLAESAQEHEEIELPEGEVPKVSRYQTWYGMDDFKRMFQRLYSGLEPNGRAARVAFTDEAIDEAVIWNMKSLDRSSRWPLERYINYVRELGICPADLSDEACISLAQQRFGGAVGGNARILYSPAVVDHALRNYGKILECLDDLDSVSLGQEPTQSDNFSLCFEKEFPINGVLVKAQWMRADFGRDVPTYDTDGEAMAALLGGSANWGEDGDRRTDPTPDEIVTIRLHNGDTYRLVGLHIMTKELRHWQWITLWWSDKPETDFGADRPNVMARQLDPVWQNYKMCVVDGFTEKDPAPSSHYPQLPSLAAAIDSTSGGVDSPTWCSNPYIEHGRNNARTNCVGCHQHAGSTVVRDTDGDGTLDPLDLEAVIEDELHFPQAGRLQIRELFPADYLYSFNRVDDFSGVINSEVSFFDGTDADAVGPRVDAILALDGTEEAGAAWFAQSCEACHGPTGEGNGFAPNLYTRVPNRDDRSILQTLIAGRGGMPAWGETFNDQQIADLLAFLRATFGTNDD